MSDDSGILPRSTPRRTNVGDVSLATPHFGNAEKTDYNSLSLGQLSASEPTLGICIFLLYLMKNQAKASLFDIKQ
jgi:hypothetical protein